MAPHFDSPNGPGITLEDLKNCGWKAALEERDEEPHGNGYAHKWTALQKAESEALSKGNATASKALSLLAHISSMMLKPENRNEPFQPAIVFSEGRTAIPSDFTEAEIDLLDQFVDGVEDPWMKARIADLLWLRQTPRNPKFALEAIDAYRSTPLNGETWASGVLDCWRRAISLSIMLGKGAGNRLSEMERAVWSLFSSTTAKENFFALKLSEILEEYNIERSNEHSIAMHLHSIAEELEAEGRSNSARSYFANAAVWFGKANNETDSARMNVAHAETYVKEAEANLTSESPSNLLASTFYERAIQIYRNIPHAYREPHQVNQRISDLRDRLNEAGLLTLGEMTSIESPALDLTPFIDDALTRVKGKATEDAVFALSNLFRVNAKEMREAAIKSLAETPLRALISSSLVTLDGRTAARNPGFNFQSGPEENNAAIEAETIRFHYEPLVNVAVMGYIIPALDAITVEHQMSEGYFVQVAKVSPIVPPGRDRLYGKALYHGYNRDFASALHLLIPQIEHMVRHHLKMNHVTTTSLDRDGIETENGLSTLVDLPEVKQIFGEDLTFELRALFCSPYGANLRNEVAHGLVEEAKCFSTHSVYAWWLGLKMAFNTFWSSIRQTEDGTTDCHSQEE